MSMTYPVPGHEREYPVPRHPGVRVRVVPNESLLRDAHPYVGELVQALCDEGWEYGTSVELDVSDRTRPGEQRGGADPMVLLAIVVLEAAAGVAIDRALDAALAWLRRHFRPTPGEPPACVVIYGPHEEVLRRVQIPDEDAAGQPD
jgi:hypothetical protein